MCLSSFKYCPRLNKYVFRTTAKHKKSTHIQTHHPHSYAHIHTHSYLHIINVCESKLIISTKQIPILQILHSSTTTTSNTEEAEPEIIMPPSPPPTSTTTVTGSHHARRGQRNDKHNRYSKNQSTPTNLATPRRPIRTPTSSPLTMSSGLNNFISPRTRLVTSELKTKQKPNRMTFVGLKKSAHNEWRLKTKQKTLSYINAHTQPLLQVRSLMEL